MLEERAPARLRAPMTPPLGALRHLIVARANAGQATQFPAAQKAVERLDVAPEAVIERDQHFSPGTLRGAEDALHAA